MQASLGMSGPGQVRNLIALGCGADRGADPDRGRGVVRLGSGTRFFRENWLEELKRLVPN